jgi:hypothetical protein
VQQFEQHANEFFNFETIFSKKLEELEQPPYLSPTKAAVIRERRN